MLDRGIPARIVLILVVVGLLGTVMFGWLVRDALGRGRSGPVGDAALAVAVFPTEVFQALREIKALVTGADADEWLSVTRAPDLDLSGHVPVPAGDTGVTGLMMRTDPDAPGASAAWRVMTGSFALDGRATNAVLILSPDLEVVRTLPVTEDGIDIEQPRPANRKMAHGLEVLDDGSMVITFDGGGSIQRIDACGRRIWGTAGQFSHSVNLAPGGDSVWVIAHLDLARIDVQTGEVVQQITPEDIMAANPGLDILGLRYRLDDDVTNNTRNTPGKWMSDALHYNDVHPLSAELAGAFPGFVAGDLLISSRSLNLVYVLDPDTLQVKWWNIGKQIRQHDPDWNADGRISIYDNRMGRDYSRIITLDPADGVQTQPEVLIDGREIDFYSRIRGKHQIMDDRIAVTSPQQGRAFEWVPGQGVVLEFLNLKPGDDTRSFLISELRVLPGSAFGDRLAACAR